MRRLRQTARSGRRVRLQVIFFRNPKIFHAVILADFCTKKINECFSPRDESYEAFEFFKILIQNAATASHLVKLKSNLAAKESVTFFSKN